MLNRSAFYLLFVCLFAIVQIGTLTHEISHAEEQLADLQDSHDYDADTAEESCLQCLSQSNLDHTNLATDDYSPFIDNQRAQDVISIARLVSQLPDIYSARAPPYFHLS